MATALKTYNGGRVLVFVMSAFAEMPADVSRICEIFAHDLARTHVSFYNDDTRRTKGMYRQRTQKAWGHTAHRGWARLLLDRASSIALCERSCALYSVFVIRSHRRALCTAFFFPGPVCQQAPPPKVHPMMVFS